MPSIRRHSQWRAKCLIGVKISGRRSVRWCFWAAASGAGGSLKKNGVISSQASSSSWIARSHCVSPLSPEQNGLHPQGVAAVAAQVVQQEAVLHGFADARAGADDEADWMRAGACSAESYPLRPR